MKYTFEKGFLLDEEKLRKIHDIISKRKGSYEVDYTVFREDSYSYKTTNIDDIISEDNLKWARINKIKVNLGGKDKGFDLTLDFDSSGVNLFINGDNRDDVFLLNSELKEYISNEVCTQKIIPADLSKLIFIGAMAALVIGLVFSSYNQPKASDEAINNILKSNDINEKVNFLVQYGSTSKQSNNSSLYFMTIPLLLLVVSLLFSEYISGFISYFFPANLFLFGKEHERYKKHLETRNKIFWAIIIGLIISIIGSLIVWRATLGI